MYEERMAESEAWRNFFVVDVEWLCKQLYRDCRVVREVTLGKVVSLGAV